MVHTKQACSEGCKVTAFIGVLRRSHPIVVRFPCVSYAFPVRSHALSVQVVDCFKDQVAPCLVNSIVKFKCICFGKIFSTAGTFFRLVLDVSIFKFILGSYFNIIVLSICHFSGPAKKKSKKKKKEEIATPH